ncbi:hypothetical protein NQ314_017896 [Rhamnusium bicolor]|uniref:Uncharacterized protein n=1 Tax=Rhamnusium bicolor TaxID=1586634 RepID=A0AAV8WSK8_9CUCU|nr:hypothetical protein NQ314_017896 [Rhamnusium bicolor]
MFCFVTDNCTALVLGIAILVSGLSPCSSAPTNSDSEWWVNPCGKQPPIRHGRSPAGNQLKIFISKINDNFFKEIKNLYNLAEIKQMKGNCPRINNMLKPIKNAKTFTTATHVVYETLLQFAFFIDKLKDIPFETNGEFDILKRKLIFEEAKENLRLVICEFNDTLTKYDTKNIQPNKPKVREINMTCLPKTLDISDAHMLDTDFFKKMKKFLKQSRARLLKLKKQKKGKKVVKKSEPKKNKRTKKLKQ